LTASIVGHGLLSLTVKLSLPAFTSAAAASAGVAKYCWDPTRLFGPAASLTWKSVLSVHVRRRSSSAGSTVAGRPLTRL
jgi:hypothetical protein